MIIICIVPINNVINLYIIATLKYRKYVVVSNKNLYL